MENHIISNDEFNRNDYDHSVEVMNILRGPFGLNDFKDIQLPVINAAILKHNCFVIMPTGGLKSLCYQLPALLSEGITVVITPLKSIIYNQLEKLESLKIGAVHFSGDQTTDEQWDIQDDLKNLKKKILYVTPDKAKWSRIVVPFLEELLEMDLISRFIIDEAHCVSESHEFRASYQLDSRVKDLFQTVPVMAFTPTATPSVQLDIMKQLKLENVKYFVSSLNRPNIKYSVVLEKWDRSENIVNFVRFQPRDDCGIVFCWKQKHCEIVAKKLEMNGIRAIAYHGDMYDSDRMKIQEDWQANKIQVLCATFALGMGIDKSNVRFVLHYSMPKSMEHYFNETGRAGHDGKLAQCILYYGDHDYSTYDFIESHKQDLFEINNYCNNYLDCRRSLLLNYFGEDFNSNDCLRNPETACDNCLKARRSKDIKVLDIVRKILKFLKANTNRQFTMFDICCELRKDILCNWEMVDKERLIVYMLKQNYLRKNITFDNIGVAQAYIDLGPKCENIMKEDVDLRFKIHTPF